MPCVRTQVQVRSPNVYAPRLTRRNRIVDLNDKCRLEVRVRGGRRRG